MNAKQMVSALKAFGNLMSGSERAALVKFAQVFDGMGEAKAAAIAGQIAKSWKKEGRAAKRPAELERALRQVEDILTATGAKTQAAVFAKVLLILAGDENQNIESFVCDAMAARVKKVPPPKPRKPKFVDLLPELARTLTAVASDRGRFDALLCDYAERYKAAELRAIADRFMGHSVPKKTKSDIVKAMHNWQREEELHRDAHALQARVGL